MRKITWVCFLVICLLTSCGDLHSGRTCSMKSILLAKKDLPAKTVYHIVDSPVDKVLELSAAFNASLNGSAIYQEIGQYPDGDTVEKEFARQKKMASGPAEYGGMWDTPSALSRSSSFFYNEHVTCGNALQGEYQCRMIGQRGDYYMFFSATITEDGITLDIFNDLMEKIDTRLEQCFIN